MSVLHHFNLSIPVAVPVWPRLCAEDGEIRNCNKVALLEWYRLCDIPRFVRCYSKLQKYSQTTLTNALSLLQVLWCYTKQCSICEFWHAGYLFVSHKISSTKLHDHWIQVFIRKSYTLNNILNYSKRQLYNFIWIKTSKFQAYLTYESSARHVLQTALIYSYLHGERVFTYWGTVSKLS